MGLLAVIFGRGGGRQWVLVMFCELIIFQKIFSGLSKGENISLNLPLFLGLEKYFCLE